MKALFPRSLALLFVLVFLSGLSSPLPPAAANALAQTNSQQPPFVDGELLLRFQPGTSAGRAAQILAEHSVSRARVVPMIEVEVLRLPRGLSVEKAVEVFSRLPEVQFAEPNYILTIAQSSTGWQANQWAPQKLQASEAWAADYSGTAVIAVVDTGVDYRHSQLNPNMRANPSEAGGQPGIDDDGNGYIDDIYGWDFANNDSDPLDDHLHGTHVAGIAAATTGTGETSMTGICPFCRIMAVKVLGSTGSGSLDAVANGITYAAKNGADVINMSLGGTAGSDALQAAVDYAWNNGVLVVAAAGNDGSDARLYPAAYPNSVAVAATNEDDYHSCFSSYGNWDDTYVELSAPGELIYSTVPLDSNGVEGYAIYSGTSMATPHVSGVAGLIFAQNPLRTNLMVLDLILTTTEDIGPAGLDPYFGTGRVNALRAVENNVTATIPPDGMFSSDQTASGYAHARKLVRDAANTLHLIWHTRGADRFQIRYATSTDEGVTWVIQPDVFSSSAETYHPALAADGANLYIAFPSKDGSANDTYRVFFSSKPLSGGAWTSPIALLGGSYHAVRPDLFVDPSNGRLHLVASSLDDLPYLYYVSSDDQGATWSSVRSVDPTTSTSVSNTRYASVHASGDNVYLVTRTVNPSLIPFFYTNFVRSMDGGLTWIDKTNFSSAVGLGASEAGMSLAGVGDRMYMGYEVGGPLYFRRYDGSTWSNYLQLESTGLWPSITQAQDGQAWQIWQHNETLPDGRVNRGNLLVRHYTGSTWELTQTLLKATGLNKGFYPNLKLGANSGKIEWVYTACPGAPFRLAYGSQEVGLPPETPPAAPADLHASAQSPSTISLTWTDTSGNEAGFQVERSADGISGWAQVGSVGANNSDYTDSGLSPQTTYYYRVRAYNNAGSSAYSNTASATTPPNAPAAPSGLAATALSTSAIDLDWSDNSSNEAGFYIERSTGAVPAWSRLATVGSGQTTYTDSGLSPNTTYSYRVQAYNAGGSSAYSNTASATTLPEANFTDITAEGETTVIGTRTGDFTRTYANDGSDEVIQEILSGGKPAKRYSYLEHKWTFNVQPGDSLVFYANTWAPASTDGDRFQFEYSTDNNTYYLMFVVSDTTDRDNYQSYSLPAWLSGALYVRVIDTNRTAGSTTLDEVFIDHLYIRSDHSSGNPPPAPPEIHVGDLDGSSAPGRSGRWNATVTIRVHDSNDPAGAVAGVAVSGSWGDGVTGTGTCTTGIDGTCQVSYPNIKTNVPSVTFSITSLAHQLYLYDSAGNHDPDGDSTGSSITVSRP